MNENPVLSYLSNIDWIAVFQWYFNHLDVGYLIRAWEQGITYSQDDWMSIMLLAAHLVVLLSLIGVLIKRYRETKFRAWVEHKRSQLTDRPAKEGQTILEPKISDSSFLSQAYNLHRYAMYDQALNKYKQAFQSSPYELNTYLVGIKIISEMEEPNKQFIRFLQAIIARLHKKHPAIWKELAKYGREKAPSLDQWQLAA